MPAPPADQGNAANSGGCHEPGIEMRETKWPDGKLRTQYEVKIGPDGTEIKHGRWVSLHQNGQVLLDGQYVDDVRHGLWMSWWDNGKLRGRAEFISGVGDGTWTKWDDTETKRIEYHIVLGQKNGHSTEWDEKGQVTEEGDYKDDQKTGIWKKRGEDGKMIETRYENGEPVP